MEIFNILQKMGLSEKETAIYLSLLKIGKSTVGKIADNTELKRPTIYLILEALRKKGLVLKIPYSKKQIFTAKEPSEFLLEKELNDFKSVVPQILALANKNNSPKIFLFEGEQGLIESYSYRLNELDGEIFLGFYTFETKYHSEKILKKMNAYMKDLVKRDIKIKGFTPEHKSIEKYKNDYTELKLLDKEEYSSRVAIEIRKDFIRISDIENLQFIIIDNKNISDTLRQIFNIMWKLHSITQ